MTSLRLPLEQCDPPRPPQDALPTMYDLPSEDPEEPGLPDEFHLLQPRLLDETFQSPNYSVEEVFTASDLNLYYDSQHPQWHKRPDWFAVVGVSRLYQGQELRLSYVSWIEGVRPLVVIEFLSPRTRNEDLGYLAPKGEQPTKWQVYEKILGIPYYVLFDRYTDELRVYALMGDRYLEQPLTTPRFWIDSLKLGLGLWAGTYRGVSRQWLRWYDSKDQWLPTEAEQGRQRAEQERQRVEQERQARAAAERRAALLAERLKALGMNPDNLED